jgi:hypothetical protein
LCLPLEQLFVFRGGPQPTHSTIEWHPCRAASRASWKNPEVQTRPPRESNFLIAELDLFYRRIRSFSIVESDLFYRRIKSFLSSNQIFFYRRIRSFLSSTQILLYRRICSYSIGESHLFLFLNEISSIAWPDLFLMTN